MPYAPGGGTDIMVRQIVKVLEEQKLVSVPVTVANRTGGSGVVGKSYAINRPADGYTLVAVDAGNWQQELQGNATWNFRKDFTYLARMVTDVNLLVVRKESPTRPSRSFSRPPAPRARAGSPSAGPTSARSTTSRTSTSTRRRRSTSPTCPSRAAAR